MTSQTSHEADDPTLDSTTQEDDFDFKVVDKGKQNMGRWSSAEHEAFLRGMATFGKSWRKVASAVGTRTIMQTRTHAQKYFEKEHGSAKSLSRATIAAKGSTPLKKRKIKTPTSKGRKQAIVPQEQEELRNREMQEAVADITYPATPQSAMSCSVTAPTTRRVPFQSPTTMLLPLIPPMAFSPNIGFPSILGYAVATVPLRDNDILFPIQADAATRPANIEYMDLLKINSFIFQVLPRADQRWWCRNLVHFLTAVRGRRWILSSNHHHNTHTPTSIARDGSNTTEDGVRFTYLRDPVQLVEEELRRDAIKIASLQACPFWIMGEFDPDHTHKGLPFIYRDVFGNWKKLKKAGIRTVLRNEGPKNLLLLPPSVRIFNDSGVAVESSSALEASSNTEAESISC